MEVEIDGGGAAYECRAMLIVWCVVLPLLPLVHMRELGLHVSVHVRLHLVSVGGRGRGGLNDGRRHHREKTGRSKARRAGNRI